MQRWGSTGDTIYICIVSIVICIAQSASRIAKRFFTHHPNTAGIQLLWDADCATTGQLV